MKEEAARPSRSEEALLSVRDLAVDFELEGGMLRAVDRISYDVHPGEIVGIVGESGSGKSVSVLAVLRLLNVYTTGASVAGEVLFEGRNLFELTAKQMREIRGKDITLIFQDPSSSWHPVLGVGRQVAEVSLAHGKMGSDRVRQHVEGLFESVGIPNPRVRYEQYPHEYSGGMKQRAMIAMAIANRPKLLIADEPTTALDVTIQSQVLELLRDVTAETGAALILISHDIGVIAEMADRVIVMYGGRVMEEGPVEQVLLSPRHPYTRGLLSSLPQIDKKMARLPTIPGSPPQMFQALAGCPFEPRCGLSGDRGPCRESRPFLRQCGEDQFSACHFFEEL
jgi:oligopeptide/dipeptide ABC transporter ATP-binding protein